MRDENKFVDSNRIGIFFAEEKLHKFRMQKDKVDYSVEKMRINISTEKRVKEDIKDNDLAEENIVS